MNELEAIEHLVAFFGDAEWARMDEHHRRELIDERLAIANEGQPHETTVKR